MTRFPFRIALVAVIVPFALAVVGVALQLAWLPELPETIATHWGFGGEPDAFGPSWTMPLLLGVLGVLFPALFGVLLARTVRPEGPTATQKLLAVASLFVVTLLSIIVTSSVAIQRGLPVGSSTPTIMPTFGIAVGVALVLSVAAWFFLPRAVSGRLGSRFRDPSGSRRSGRARRVGRAREVRDLGHDPALRCRRGRDRGRRLRDRTPRRLAARHRAGRAPGVGARDIELARARRRGRPHGAPDSRMAALPRGALPTSRARPRRRSCRSASSAASASAGVSDAVSASSPAGERRSRCSAATAARSSSRWTTPRRPPGC